MYNWKSLNIKYDFTTETNIIQMQCLHLHTQTIKIGIFIIDWIHFASMQVLNPYETYNGQFVETFKPFLYNINTIETFTHCY